MTHIPSEMRTIPQWVGFTLENMPNGRTSKKPIDPRTLYGASSTNPDTWGTYEEALACIGKDSRFGKVDGVGFVLSPPYCGIDLDHVIDSQTGELHADAIDIVETMDSYTERSPSGTGLHIIYRGSVHPEWKKKQAGAFGENTDLEMYQQGRYFTVTGDVFENYTDIHDREDYAALVQKTYMKKQKQESHAQKAEISGSVTMQEDELLDAARNSKNGLLFSDLMEGRWEKYYGSQSEADMALCSMLAFWFCKDERHIDKVFRQSGLMRDKWDRKQSGSTYGALTVKKAVNDCREVYTGKSLLSQGDYEITIMPKQWHSFDDTGNALRMVDMFGDKIRYHYADKRWLIYDKVKWCYDNAGLIWKMIDRTMAAIALEEKHYADLGLENEFQKHLKKCRSNNAKRALEKEIQHHVGITPGVLDRHKLLLNTPGGVVDLKTFTVTPNDPGNYITKATAVSYKPDAECPLWLKFLGDIFAGDLELIRYVQKAVGYSLSGLTDEQCAFILYGNGRNGKSTWIDIIRYICGDYATNIQPETLMTRTQSSTANSDIARLKGARFVTSVEPNEGVRLNEGLLKQLTGDDVVTARKLYGDEFEFKPEFKLWMATNHRPVIRGTDTGIWRRIHLIPFTVQIPEDQVDKKLKDKLLHEAEGILCWCVEGMRLYHEEGLQKPASVCRATEEYRKDMDTISKFLDECTVSAPMRCVKAKDLYTVYTKWCDLYGEFKLTNTQFGREITKRHQKRRTMNGNVYDGLDFSADYKQYSISIETST